MLAEFKKFALKGNMIDLAVGVIIGGAFNNIVSSLVNDLIMPILSIFTGSLDFTNWFIAINGKHYDTIELAKAAGVATINYGTFLSGVINFLIIAFVLFIIVRQINKIRSKFIKEAEQKPTTKKCPRCLSEINILATKCPHCTTDVEV
jgi:large conductance mechanosensitive channel